MPEVINHSYINLSLENEDTESPERDGETRWQNRQSLVQTSSPPQIITNYC